MAGLTQPGPRSKGPPCQATFQLRSILAGWPHRLSREAQGLRPIAMFFILISFMTSRNNE